MSEFNSDFIQYSSTSSICSNISICIKNSMSSISLSSSVTYGPAVIYINQSYPNVLWPKSIGSSSANFFIHNKNIYNDAGNSIMFCFFTVGYMYDNSTIQDLLKKTTMSKEEIQDYSTISITPQGNFITSPIIFDRIFSQNGLLLMLQL